MKVSSAWIKEWLCRTMLTDEEIVQGLEKAGIEIEQITSSKEIDKRVVVALVKKVVQHPGADRLKLVEVTTGESDFHIVCGAPNVREGLKVALAQIGTTLPGGDKIERAKLRGEVSEGMLCSEFELGLGNNHNGIIELSSDVAVGTSLCDIYPADTVVDIKTPPNRFDVLSVVGLAREVAAMTPAELKPLAPPPVDISKTGPKVSPGGAAGRYMLAHIKVDQSTPSPRWVTSKLESAGMRSLSPVVDITNYAMLELGQPLHAFDAGKIKFPIEIRHARAGEVLTTLDGVNRKLSPADLVIADLDGPVALAGLMGGARSEVGAGTKEILLEVAVFDAPTVRKMAKRHGLRTEASSRYERGLPVQLPPIAMARANELLSEVAGGKLISATDQLNEWPWTQRIGLRSSRLSKLVGLEISTKDAITSLTKLQINAQKFDIVGESHKLVGKTYKYGASFKADGSEAFDCSYLTDYLYSLVGLQIGFTALAQYELANPVADGDLLPGDLVFCEGDKTRAATDHYFTRLPDGKYERHAVKPAKRVGHVGIYIGNNEVVHASPKDKRVVVSPLSTFTEASDYLGARRVVENLDDYISVPEVPWWRTDLRMAEDLIEEIVRVRGYDKVPSTIPAWRPKQLVFDQVRSVRRRIRDVLYGAGLFEVMTYSFVSAEQLTSLGLKPEQHPKLKNPLSSEQAYLRSTMLPSHLTALSRNRSYAKSISFYEISNVFVKQADGKQPLETLTLAACVSRPEQAYAHAKGLLDAVAHELNISLEVVPNESEVYAGGRSAEIKLGRTTIGQIGQVHPKILSGLKIDSETSAFEIALQPVLEAAKVRKFAGVERFPTIVRDVAVLLPERVTWHDVVEAAKGYDIEFAGDYYGEELPDGYKSVTIRLEVKNPESTPTEADAAEVQEKVLLRLEHTLGAKPRD